MKHGILLGACLFCTTATQARDAKIEHSSAALEFTYDWPAQAARVPALDRRFRSYARKAYRRALDLARENQDLYREQKRDGARDFYSMKWSTAGESARLLSLHSQLSTFTGGAHPNTSFGALLWEKNRNRETGVPALFINAADFPALSRAAYCEALDAERFKRRGGEKLGAVFDKCPKFADLAIAPLDRNGNGRFDAIDFVASPYTAGPYAEGEYEIALPVTSKTITLLTPRFRASFETQRQ